jgi:hypothetical protein
MKRSVAAIGLASVFLLDAPGVAQRGGGPAVPPPRDTTATPTGTAIIAGVVVVDGPDRRPLPRASVTLRGGDITTSRLAITDDEGRFAFADLPAGRFTLSVIKPTYVSATYGARSQDAPGTPIAVTDGSRTTDLVVPIARGAVITGRILDEHGGPATSYSTSVVRERMVAGKPTFTPTFGAAGGTADDRGIYRLYGLPAGTYVVVVSRFSSPANLPRVTTQAEVMWARSEGTAAPGLAPRTTVAPARGPVLSVAPVFYPGTTDIALAERITVAAGEERAGIDFVVRMVPTSTISGSVYRPDGQPAPGVPVTAVNMASSTVRLGLPELPPRAITTRTGQFTMGGLAPGRYLLAVQGSSGLVAAAPAPLGGRGGPPLPVMDLWAQEEITVSGEDISNVRFSLTPGMAISGRVAFEGTAPPPDFTSVRISVTPPPTTTTVMGLSSTQVATDGTFKLSGAAPGQYLMSAALAFATSANPTWMLKSVTADGRNVQDSPLEVRPGIDVDNAVITFTDRVTRLSGALTDQAGRPAPDYFVIVFSTNPDMWFRQSRWLRAPQRPATNGTFTIAALPPGEYYMAALTEYNQTEWFAPAFLQQVVPSALKITIAEGEHKTQDIRLAGN